MNVLVWDFDNTLAYRDGMWTRTLHHVLTTHGGVKVDETALRPYLENGFPWNRHMESHASYFQGLSWWEYLYTVLAPAMTGNGVSDEDTRKLLPIFRETYLDMRYWYLFADTARTLEKAVAFGYANYILSNHVPELQMIVDGLGLTAYFRQVITSAELGYEKPNPNAFQAVLKQLGPNDTVCMIGDNYTADVLGARVCGMDAILVRGNNSNGYARHADDLDGIWQYLNEPKVVAADE